MPFDFDAQLAMWKTSLLDTTKRNRLIKFTTGRSGGVGFLLPTVEYLWRELVVNEQPFLFPWKRDLLGLAAEEVDREPTPPSDAIPVGTSNPEPPREKAVTPILSNTPGIADAAPSPSEEPKKTLVSAAGENTTGSGSNGAEKAVSGNPGAEGEVGEAKNFATAERKKTPESPQVPQPKVKTIADLTDECRRSRRLRPEHLLTDLTDKKLAANLLRLARNASEAETDHGVSILYAAFGFLKWFEGAESATELRSPLVLVPVRLGRETVESAWTLKAAEDDPSPNHCLAELLKNEFRVTLPDAKEGEIDAEDAEGLTRYLARVAASVRSMPRWEVVADAGLGVFNFQKLAMWEDLENNAGRIKAHPLCLALAGDHAVELRPPPDMVAAAELDERVPPESVTHILDADSSQHEAVEAIKRGANVVIDGPPGTGKSQTIANAIAELLGAGKTVLFVSEKTAALEVVKRRLDDRGLGDFCLELHSHKANKREVAAEIGRSLELAAESFPDAGAELLQLADERRTLNAYASELHRRRLPLGMSAFRVHGELAALENLAQRSQWSATDPLSRDGEYLRRVGETLARLGQCRAVVENPNAHPWRGCRLVEWSATGFDDVRHHFARLAASAPALVRSTTLQDLALEGACETVAQWTAGLRVARAVIAVPVVPGWWLSGDPVAATAAVSGLHAATTEARTIAQRLPMFSPAALRAVSPAAAAGMAAALNPSRELLADATGPARLRAARLMELAQSLGAALPDVTALKDAFARLLATLRLPPKQPAADLAKKYAMVALEVAEGSPVRPSWWNPAKRAELREVMVQSGESEVSARAIRARLAGTFAPQAFSPEVAGTFRDALHRGSSLFRRLFSGWAKVRREVAAWYVTPPKTRAALMADVAVMADFHRRSAYVRQVEAGYTADFLSTPSGSPDWPATIAGLAAIEKYEKRNLPQELKAALTTDGGLDRAELAAAGRGVVQAETAFRKTWATLAGVYSFAATAESTNRTAAEIIDAVGRDRDAATGEANALLHMTGLLAGETDVPASNWRAHSADVDRLVRLRAEAAAHVEMLSPDPADPITVEQTDWSREAVAAEKLAAFLRRLGRSPSPATAAALTDPAVRTRVEAAMAASDEALNLGFEESWNYVVRTVFDPAEPVSDGIVLGKAAIPRLAEWFAARRDDCHRLEEWVLFGRVRREAAADGVGAVVEEVMAGRIDAGQAGAAFRQRFFKFWIDELYLRVPALREFASDAHDARIARFAHLDRLSVAAAPAWLRSRLLAHPNRPRADGSAPPTSELGIVLGQAHKKRGHLPLRKLFSKVPTLLPRLKPCMMMSPLAVSTYLSGPNVTFDAVIFDEASQVRPHDAICAVYRGRQLVVAGDPKQLPPTSFFDRATDDDADPDDENTGTAGFESLLDVCLSLGIVRKRLRWHYRSRHEGLIAFSNKFFYDGALVTFPSADDGTGRAVRWEFVPDGLYADTVNVPEAKYTAALVARHFQERPDHSLGVIAFSQSQQNRILDELEAVRRAHPELEGFFKEDRPDRFFVKNLENVQGDERDAIILSVGYGPDAVGKVAMRFGPLNRQGGERRLNVAITRARYSMTVVSSLTAADIDLSRTQAVGPKLLRAFLDYAERGPAALNEAVTEADAGGFDSPFEREVFEELQRRGLTLHKQVGCGGYKIDMAVADPDAGGSYLLGIECDGATYHSSATARDRDRLRQAVLEGLGWRLCRIWSTDWLRNRDKQVGRVLSALQSRPAKVNRPAALPAAVPLPMPKSSPVVAPAPTVAYERIEDVPEGVIRVEAVAAAARFGTMEPDVLCGCVAKGLGFKRLGAKIKARIDQVLDALVRTGELERQPDGGLRIPSRPTFVQNLHSR